MTVELPRTIADYFEADRGKHVEAVARCFVEGAIVKDEGHTYTGIQEIRQWKADTSTKYTYTAEPFAIAIDSYRTVVTSRLTGDFPGSPTDLRYFFVIAGAKIAELEIVP